MLDGIILVVLLFAACGAILLILGSALVAFVGAVGGLVRLFDPKEREQKRKIAAYYEWRKANPEKACRLDEDAAYEQKWRIRRT